MNKNMPELEDEIIYRCVNISWPSYTPDYAGLFQMATNWLKKHGNPTVHHMEMLNDDEHPISMNLYFAVYLNPHFKEFNTLVIPEP